MTARRFRVCLDVTEEAAADPNLVRAVREALVAALDHDLIGPRGGRYVPFGMPMFLGIDRPGDYFIRNWLMACSTRMARYARPRR